MSPKTFETACFAGCVNSELCMYVHMTADFVYPSFLKPGCYCGHSQSKNQYGCKKKETGNIQKVYWETRNIPKDRQMDR